jgi:DNA-binding CsgD family transcriptional regulator
MLETATKRLSVSEEGIILLNSCLRPIFINRTAAEILSHVHKPAKESLENFLTNRIRSLFFTGKSLAALAVVTAFESGDRVYEGRAYRVNALADGDSQVSIAILLQRVPGMCGALDKVSEKFHLTTREQEVLNCLSDGLTTKEIAAGLQISPHTVKAFLRMIMVKMGVSTRSGIVGKAFATRL